MFFKVVLDLTQTEAAKKYFQVYLTYSEFFNVLCKLFLVKSINVVFGRWLLKQKKVFSHPPYASVA